MAEAVDEGGMWTSTVQEAPLPGWNTQSALSCHVSVSPDSAVYK